MATKSPAAKKLKALRERSGLSVRALAELLGGMKHTSYAYYEDDYKEDELNPKVARQLAKILTGKGDPAITEAEVLALAGIEVVTAPATTSAAKSRRVGKSIALAPDVLIAMRPVEVIGAVQAGVWLATVELPAVDRFEIPLPIQAGFDNFDVFGLIVRGASMDEIYPHGSILAVVKFLDLGRDPRSGERVVALRFRHGESEATVKEFRVGKDGKARLWPRSTHPDFQSPVLVDQPSDEAEEVQIAYLVIGSYRPEI